jgi:hypothetical protein
LHYHSNKRAVLSSDLFYYSIPFLKKNYERCEIIKQGRPFMADEEDGEGEDETKAESQASPAISMTS